MKCHPHHSDFLTSTWSGKSNSHVHPVMLQARAPRQSPIKWQEVSAMLRSPSESWLGSRSGFELQSAWENQKHGGRKCRMSCYDAKEALGHAEIPWLSCSFALSFIKWAGCLLSYLLHHAHEENRYKHTGTRVKAAKINLLFFDKCKVIYILTSMQHLVWLCTWVKTSLPLIRLLPSETTAFCYLNNMLSLSIP